MTKIFATQAPLYWSALLPAIPLRQCNKMPDIKQWQVFGSRMPTEAEQHDWLASFPFGNIGLPFGPASGLCGVDIDTEDQELIAAIESILPRSPWERVGKKGKLLVYRFSGHRNFKLGGADSGMICEFLGLGNQAVMPGSIHPDTRKPYVSNCNLWEVLDQIHELPVDIEEQMRSLLAAKGLRLGTGSRPSPVEIVPAGERDNQMTRQAGYLARVVQGIDKHAKFSLYDAIEHMHTWVEEYTAKIRGDSIDPGKGVTKLIEFLLNDVRRGKPLPRGWDGGLPESLLDHPSIRELREVTSSQQWTLSRMVDELTTLVGDRMDDREHIEASIRQVASSAAKDPFVEEYDFRCLHERICQKYPDLKMKWATLKQLYISHRPDPAFGEELSDHHAVATAVLEDMERSGEIRYDHGEFWQWNGSRFEKKSEHDIHLHIAQTVKGCAIVRRENDYASVVRLLRKMCSARLRANDICGVNFANGFLSERGDLMAHDPSFGRTFTLPFEYDLNSVHDCTEWMRFLEACWGHEPDFQQHVMALQEAFATTMFGLACRFQRAFLLFGQSRSGKSQLLNVLQALLPTEATASLGPDLWGERFNLTHLIGATANICNELPENARIKGNTFKQVVEGSTLFTEAKNKDGFFFSPTCAHWFASNFLPWTSDTSDGFARRWMILDFNKRVSNDELEPDIGARIVAQERHAIAAWAVAGLPRLLDNGGYTLPDCHWRREQEMRRANNSVLAFLDDSRAVVRGEGMMPLDELYRVYRSHMETIRATPVPVARFAQMVEELGLRMERNHDSFGHPNFLVYGIVPAALPRRAA